MEALKFICRIHATHARRTFLLGEAKTSSAYRRHTAGNARHSSFFEFPLNKANGTHRIFYSKLRMYVFRFSACRTLWFFCAGDRTSPVSRPSTRSEIRRRRTRCNSQRPATHRVLTTRPCSELQRKWRGRSCLSLRTAVVAFVVQNSVFPTCCFVPLPASWC